MRYSEYLWSLFLVLSLILFSACSSQNHAGSQAKNQDMTAHQNMDVPLHQPGNATFGAIQEVVNQLRADSTTDWSKVNLEALRQHLIDMHEFTLHVDVMDKHNVENGVQFTVEPTTDRALPALERVFKAHPPMLKQEKGWTMNVEQDGKQFTATVTTPNPEEVPQLRALGYIGVLATGVHHQRHHWMMATGKDPHQMGE